MYRRFEDFIALKRPTLIGQYTKRLALVKTSSMHAVCDNTLSLQRLNAPLHAPPRLEFTAWDYEKSLKR